MSDISNSPWISQDRTGQQEFRAHPKLSTTRLPEERFYTCTLRNASMHRPDGVRVAFAGPGAICATDIMETVDFLETEIAHGNQYIRPSTEAEVAQYNAIMHPVEHLRAEAKRMFGPEYEASVRTKLEAEIRAQILAERQDGQVQLTDGEKLGGVEQRINQKPVDVGNGNKLTLTGAAGPISTVGPAGPVEAVGSVQNQGTLQNFGTSANASGFTGQTSDGISGAAAGSVSQGAGKSL